MSRTARAFAVFVAVAFLPPSAGCRSGEKTETVSSSRSVALTVTGCAPNDGLDDSACIQAALDAACAAGDEVRLGAGIWNVMRPPIAGGNRDNASIWADCATGSHLSGVGRPTVIMMTGDGLASDWSGIRFAGPSSGGSISEMTIAADLATNVNEQTHLLFFGSPVSPPGPVTDVTARHLWLRHPVRPTEVAGDCLRFVGDVASPVSGIDVTDVVFEACDRSGVSIQRGSSHLGLHNLRFRNIGKTAIDMEPSGSPVIEYVAMSDLDVAAPSGISISGSGGSGTPVWTTNVTLEDSFVGGRIGITYAKGVSLSDVRIAETATSGDGSLLIRGSSDVTVTGGSVTRLAGSTAGPAVKLVGTNGTYSSGATLTGVHISTANAGAATVDLESAQDVSLIGCTITSADATFAGVYSRATGQDIGGFIFTGNRFKGTLSNAFTLAGNPKLVGTALLTANTAPGLGLRCDNPAKFTKPIVQASNHYGGAAVTGCTGVSVVTASP